jgi:hypothetical protein
MIASTVGGHIMKHCPGCGAEVDAHMKHCWECHEPIGASSADHDDTFDEDDELELPGDRSSNGARAGASAKVARATAPVADELEDVADALLASDDPETENEVRVVDETLLPDTAVVAYVAQDEVQAGTISQLLSDCGIRNFATSAHQGKEDEDAGTVLQVQVLQEDLAAAQQLIEEFTAEFDDFS